MEPKRKTTYVYSWINGGAEELGELTEFSEGLTDKADEIGDFVLPRVRVIEYEMKIKAKEGYNKLLWKLGMKSQFDYKANNWRKFHKIPMRRRKPRERLLNFEIKAEPAMFTYQEDQGKIYLENECTTYELSICTPNPMEG